MKRLFLLFNLFLSVFSLNAQEPESDYRPFIEEGKVWVSTCYHEMLRLHGLEYFRTANTPFGYFLEYNYFDGDTIVGDRRCVKWVCHYYSPKKGKSVILYLPVFEEEKKVWFYFDTAKEPLLAYDFNAEQGDTIVTYSPIALLYSELVGKVYDYETFLTHYCDTSVIHSQGEEEHGGKVLRTTHFYSAKWDQNDNIKPAAYNKYFMEGVGNHWSPEYSCSLGEAMTYPFLIYCTVGDEILYEDKYFADLFEVPKDDYQNYQRVVPSPSSITTLSTRSSNATVCFDLSGRRLSVPSASSVLPPGVYIKDGKKVMVK